MNGSYNTPENFLDDFFPNTPALQARDQFYTNFSA